MSQRTVKPTDVKSLQDWVKRWPKVGNLAFDAETREATIYTAADKASKTGSIPWKREADIMTVLTQPARFSEAAVTAARKRIGGIRDAAEQTRIAGEGQLRIQEAALLEAWRAYRQAPSSSLMQAVLEAEAAVNSVEKTLQPKGRVTVEEGGFLKAYVPPIANNQRGLLL